MIAMVSRRTNSSFDVAFPDCFDWHSAVELAEMQKTEIQAPPRVIDLDLRIDICSRPQIGF